MTTKSEKKIDEAQMITEDVLAKLEDHVHDAIDTYLSNGKYSHLVDEAINKVGKAKERTEKVVKERPYQLIGTALLAGLATGWLLRGNH